MPRWFPALGALVLSLGVSGCATLTRSQCETGDWHQIGMSDGYHGYAGDRFDRHVESCTQYDVTPDRTLYLAGYKEGLTSYCRLERAVSEGEAGNPYHQVCDGQIGLSFGRVYLEAHEVFVLNDDIRDIEADIRSLVHTLRSPELSPEERNATGWRLQELQNQLFSKQVALIAQQTRLNRILASETERLKALGLTA